MEVVIAEINVRDVSESRKDEFIRVYLDLIETSNSIIKIKEYGDNLQIIKDSSNMRPE